MAIGICGPVADLSLIRPPQAKQQIKRRRLPGSIRSDDGTSPCRIVTSTPFTTVRRPNALTSPAASIKMSAYMVMN